MDKKIDEEKFYLFNISSKYARALHRKNPLHVHRNKMTKNLHILYTRELIIDHLVGFLVVEPVHLGSSPQLGTAARIFMDLTMLCFQ